MTTKTGSDIIQPVKPRINIEVDHKDKETIRKICTFIIDWIISGNKIAEKYYLISYVMLYYALLMKKIKTKICTGKNSYEYVIPAGDTTEQLRRRTTVKNWIWLEYTDSSGRKFIIDIHCLFNIFLVNPIILSTNVPIVDDAIINKFQLPCATNRCRYESNIVGITDELGVFGTKRRLNKMVREVLETVDYERYRQFVVDLN